MTKICIVKFCGLRSRGIAAAAARLRAMSGSSFQNPAPRHDRTSAVLAVEVLWAVQKVALDV